MEIYCRLSGQKAHQLLSHLREVHQMRPDKYHERCSGAPVISEDLATYIKESRIVATQGGVKRQVELLGVEFVTDILPGEFVPARDEAYVFQEDLARQVLISLVTFPGVIVHEAAHLPFCRLRRMPVVEVCFFRVGNPAGYVIRL